LKRMGYCLHGSLAVEMALKLAFKNQPQRHNVIVLQDAYHGRSLTTMAASWPHPNNPFLAIQPRFTRVPHPDPYRPRLGLDVEKDSALCCSCWRTRFKRRRRRRRGDHAGTDSRQRRPYRVAAFVPRRCARDLHPPRHRFDLDEIQTCFGRTGAMFAADLYGIVPDIMTFGKGIGGGFPLAASWRAIA